MSEGLGTTRGDARARALQARRDLDPSERLGANAAIGAHLLQLAELQDVTAVLVYAPTPDEAAPTAATTAWAERGVRLLYPRVVGGSLEVVYVASPDDLMPGYAGILEPFGPAVAPSEIEAALVPGVAFDTFGMRLGHGRGFYDRLLPMLRLAAPRIGLAFDCQIIDRLAGLAHDEPVDLVVTESAIHRTNARP